MLGARAQLCQPLVVPHTACSVQDTGLAQRQADTIRALEAELEQLRGNERRQHDRYCLLELDVRGCAQLVCRRVVILEALYVPVHQRDDLRHWLGARQGSLSSLDK